MSSELKQMVKGLIKNEYLFSIFAKLITMFISLLQSILVARYLGTFYQGEMAYITSISSIGAIVITFGFHQAYPYFRKEYGKDKIYHSNAFNDCFYPESGNRC